MSFPGSVAKVEVKKVWETLGISRDDYMMLYFDFPKKKVMALDHVAKHVPVGDIYDLVTEEGKVISFKIRKLMVKQPAKER